jgi:hypothetical protein
LTVDVNAPADAAARRLTLPVRVTGLSRERKRAYRSPPSMSAFSI